ncbi:MAG TPA: 5-formyltetrahydrofolate cyclo-ligase [Nitrososphaera sp.]|nr:5-formyltetrahydrofolate cyclo-ligase [Nitrososphaera sp.]
MRDLQDGKCELRNRMLSLRNGLAEPKIRELGLQIQHHVIDSRQFQSAESIGVYHASGTEVGTDVIIERAKKLGKTVSLPSVEGDDIVFYEFSSSKYLVKGRFGIMEPLPYRKTGQMDLMLVPGIAFDRDGYRLGYGKGYYDRYLSLKPTYSIGLAYSFQVTNNVPRHSHDRRVDAIATEKEIISCGA